MTTAPTPETLSTVPRPVEELKTDVVELQTRTNALYERALAKLKKRATEAEVAEMEAERVALVEKSRKTLKDAHLALRTATDRTLKTELTMDVVNELTLVAALDLEDTPEAKDLPVLQKLNAIGSLLEQLREKLAQPVNPAEQLDQVEADLEALMQQVQEQGQVGPEALVTLSQQMIILVQMLRRGGVPAGGGEQTTGVVVQPEPEVTVDLDSPVALRAVTELPTPANFKERSMRTLRELNPFSEAGKVVRLMKEKVERATGLNFRDLEDLLERRNEFANTQNEQETQQKAVAVLLLFVERTQLLPLRLKADARSGVSEAHKKVADAFIQEMNHEGEADEKALARFKLWIRMNQHRIEALAEVEKVPAPVEPGGTPAGVDSAPVNPPSPTDRPAGEPPVTPPPAETRAPAVETTVESQNKRKLVALFKQVAGEIDAAATEDAKLDLAPSIANNVLWQAVNRIMAISTGVLEGSTQPFDAESAANKDGVRALVLAARAESYYNRMKNPTKTRQELAELVEKVVKSVS